MISGNFSGADVEQLLVLSERLQQESRKLSEIAFSSNLALTVAEWTGAEIDQIRGVWNRRSMPNITRLAAELSELALTILRQANDQTQASGASLFTDLNGDIHVAGGDPTPAPTTTRGYIDTLRGMIDKEDGVRIQKIICEDGATRYVVYIAGSGSAKNGTLSWGNNLGAVDGFDFDGTRASIVDEIKARIGSDSTPPGPEIMIVGHSQGGMIAQSIADTSGLNVTQVVAYGSPDVTDQFNYLGANVLRLNHNGDPVINIGRGISFKNPILDFVGDTGKAMVGLEIPQKGVERDFSGGQLFNHSSDVHGGESDYGWLADRFDESQDPADVATRTEMAKYHGTVIEDFR